MVTAIHFHTLPYTALHPLDVDTFSEGRQEKRNVSMASSGEEEGMSRVPCDQGDIGGQGTVWPVVSGPKLPIFRRIFPTPAEVCLTPDMPPI